MSPVTDAGVIQKLRLWDQRVFKLCLSLHSETNRDVLQRYVSQFISSSYALFFPLLHRTHKD